ncbi:MAG: hypothetical protein IJF15_03325, partial [Oscillospiraceae bacterium]|nr:hypothetical protein [Oscillospiraceae bacterium]
VVELLRGTVPGVALPRGTRLMKDGGDGESILFETVGDVYITNSRITDIFSLSGTKGRIYPLLGDLKPAQLAPEGNSAEDGLTALAAEEEKPQTGAFAMFDYEDAGIEKNALLMYHRTAFGADASVPLQISVRTAEGASLAETLCDGARWRWSYYTDAGLCPFARVELFEDTVLLQREGTSVPLRMDGNDYHLICLESLLPIESSIIIGDIRVSSRKEPSAPEFILNDGEELDAQRCMPLGETASLFGECYICDDQVFSQQDATVTLSFRLSSKKKMLHLTAQQESDELKVIKRKPQAIQYHTAAASPERIAIEYFNGQLWRRLPCESDWATIFDGTHEGAFEITFRAPSDWKALPINGYDGRSLRLRVTQADNCYLLPCEHTMPVLEDVRIAYAYEGAWKQPQKLRTVCGTQTADVTHALLNGERITAFSPLPYPAASLYLGFDRPIEGAPVSILFEVDESVHFRMDEVTFEYSTRTGFKQMKVIDGTDNFSGAGTVLFMPPSDFAAVEVEGIRRRWLRICGSEHAAEGYHPTVRRVLLNAVDIQNKQTQDEESFYVETSAPNMRFRLAARNVLSAEVFVSEFGQLSRSQMREMLEKHPGDVRAEYDNLGEIVSFFVRWTEVESFDRSRAGDRHYIIDRAQNMLIFGDGVHVRIPASRAGEAILVRAVSCDGAKGNVDAGTVSSFYGNVMYVESVSNPAATCAGSDMEDLDSARRRGADIISGRGRLISEVDFVRAVRAFSSTVEKVKCLAGYTIDGREDPALITIAVMTRDYEAGAHSFNNIREPLRRVLLERCDATVAPECLVVAEPVYVEISLSVWVKADDAARAFDVQDLILESVRSFIDPIAHTGHSGWEIGVLPSENQLKMRLQSLRFGGHIERMIAVARYVDRNGVHEASLDALPHSPFAIGVNGEHKVHIEFQ